MNGALLIAVGFCISYFVGIGVGIFVGIVFMAWLARKEFEQRGRIWEK